MTSDLDQFVSLEKLQERVTACALCPRLVEHRETVAEKKRRMYLDWEYWGKPLPSFGDPGARLLLVGLAPAAHGGNRTGRMFTGDRSGDWVFGTLHRFGFASSPDSQQRGDGLVLKDAYITAALRCAPPANKPTRVELAACQPYFLRELELLTNLKVVVALGKIGFDAFLGTFPPRRLTLPSPRPKFGHQVEYELDGGVRVLGSYHPSQQNTQTGRLTQPMFDAVFRRAREILDQG